MIQSCVLSPQPSLLSSVLIDTLPGDGRNAQHTNAAVCSPAFLAHPLHYGVELRRG